MLNRSRCEHMSRFKLTGLVVDSQSNKKITSRCKNNTA